MLREDKHQTKAERNEQFAASLDVTDPVHDSWVLLLSFIPPCTTLNHTSLELE
jgi:hypothetical protein